MENIAEKINALVWSLPVIGFILGAGLYFTVKSRFFQVRGVKQILKNTFLAPREEGSFLREFRSMTLVLGASIGTGNITGVASAIVSGGAGAVFWMLFSAFFGMMLSYTENVFGYRFREMKNGSYRSGGMYYIREISVVVSVIFAILGIFSALGIGNAVQTGTTAAVLYDGFGIKKWITGVALGAVMLLVVFSSKGRLFSFMGKLIPAASLFYTLATLVIIVANGKYLPRALGEIFKGAFGIGSMSAGLRVGAVRAALNAGLRRGVFSNEAGLGVSPMAHASANMKSGEIQGSWGIFEVFFDTFVMCTLTALAVLTSRAWREGSFTSEDTLVNAVFALAFGDMGKKLVSASLALFAFTTLAGWSFYGEETFCFIFPQGRAWIFKAAYALLIPIFAISKSSLLWAFTDACNGIMMIINISALLTLGSEKHMKATCY